MHAVQTQIYSPAQRQCVNEVMLAAALRLAGAIEELTARGFTVLRVDFTPARPTITVLKDGRCQALIESGEAAYYSFGREAHFGPYRAAQFKCEGCRVVWSELES
ncbi:MULTISPECIES: hypothetical protein [Chromobacterium]|uniref:Uncharacterized protein n=1 Tax=Chromobacterium aquaticum TaxID=467180 RepID=A0ABV8ZXX4_9NEIS|nr:MULTISPECIES: hypothetical protein [Chromobacterium]RBH39053.1 hypothetical protein C3F00_042715 [Pseudomonas sp. MWU13-2860]MCD5362768.1 hypothetical protein [Chromobacterium aquaticum]MCP1290709.1 hypothetical protein [Chromobacterium sp. S0633]PTU71453.1 hypothetical protein DBB33_19355 [Chromobacterium haemolyticum]QOD81402.1 hypothetical protein IEZ30_15925 [Chromobacterium haemolyticum]